MKVVGCALCEGPGGAVVFQAPAFRVIRAAEPGFPAFYRLVWMRHVAEFSELEAAERQHCMESVARIEELVRRHLQPAKINLASLGNAVPHLHWHVIARFQWDSHFPDAVWAPARRLPPPAEIERVQSLLPALDAAIAAQLGSARPA
jgi:diadenosine tetraphosphate (Ap4A) HIT family hydrolase